MILDPTPNAAPRAKIPTSPFFFKAKPQKRLLTACEIVQYYDTTGRGITTSNILWNTVINNFEAQWKAQGTKIGRRARRPKDHQHLASNLVDPCIWVLPRQDHRALHHPLILRCPLICNHPSSCTTPGSRPDTLRIPRLHRGRARG